MIQKKEKEKRKKDSLWDIYTSVLNGTHTLTKACQYLGASFNA